MGAARSAGAAGRGEGKWLAMPESAKVRSAGQPLPMGGVECECGRLGRMSDARIFPRTHLNERGISRGLE